ncbi:hypothetical protein AB7M49_004300 [Bradyrhizobium elkanii]
MSKASLDGDDYRVNAEESFSTSWDPADDYTVQTRTPRAKDQAGIYSFEIGRTNVPSRSSPTHPSVSSFLYGFGSLAVL